jgi:hypothetical protein
MRELRRGQEQGTQYLVLNRSCADLYDEIAELFANRPYIKVVVDRRRGKGRMTTIPGSSPARGQSPLGRRLDVRHVSVERRRQAS